jgi:hypothetical protein
MKFDDNGSPERQFESLLESIESIKELKGHVPEEFCEALDLLVEVLLAARDIDDIDSIFSKYEDICSVILATSGIGEDYLSALILERFLGDTIMLFFVGVICGLHAASQD